MEELRTDDQMTRWFLMFLCDEIELLYTVNASAIEQNYLLVYDTQNSNGVRYAFRQMYRLFDGLRSGVHKEAYYQAISALLVPYDTKIRGSVDWQSSNDEIKVRGLFAWCSRVSRNLCMHNRFESVISAKASLFISLLVVSATLSTTHRNDLNAWYCKCIEYINGLVPSVIRGSKSGNDKVKAIIESLYNNNDINIGQNKAKSYSTYGQFTYRDILYAFTNNNKILDPNNGLSRIEKENYYIFSLAAACVKWFDNKTKNDVINLYGAEIGSIYELALKIVNEYSYPLRVIV